MEKVILYQDNNIEIYLTGKSYDFIAVVNNFSNETFKIKNKNENTEDFFEEFNIEPKNWVGILGDEDGYAFIKATENNNFILEALT